MKLLLCRHSIQSDDYTFSDAERPLTQEGKELEQKTIVWIEKLGIVPKVVITSPMQRAKETGALIAEHFQAQCLVEKALSYNFDEERLIQIIEEKPADTICFVGHGPSISEFARSLARESNIPEIHRASALLFDVDTTRQAFLYKPLAYINPQGVTPLASFSHGAALG